MKIPEYKETHIEGLISIENLPEKRHFRGDLGIQIAKDGRVWICIDGVAFIRFKPHYGFSGLKGGRNNGY